MVRRSRERQRAALAELAESAPQAPLELDWMQYKEIPKQEILDTLGAQGWGYVDQNPGGKSWILRFVWQRTSAPQQT